MKKIPDIEEDEIRVVGGNPDGDRKHLPWWVWVAAAAAVIAVVAILLYPKSQSEEKNTPNPVATEPEATDIWYSNFDDSRPSCIYVTDTLIDTLHLSILTPYNAVPELHVGWLDTADSDIILATMAADLRRDNGKIVGAFVYAGNPLSWGLSKKGYCAIIDGRITLGVAENSPLFEQATESGGYFFRQYPAVTGGVMVENNPENAAFRRALCLLNGKVCIIACTDRVLMNDFSATLVKLGVKEAILLVGGTSTGWYRTDDGTLQKLGTAYSKKAKYINYLVFRKQ